jgi:hypothetical protein
MLLVSIKEFKPPVPLIKNPSSLIPFLFQRKGEESEEGFHPLLDAPSFSGSNSPRGADAHLSLYPG